MLADMYLCASTIDGASFQQRREAASAGGYAGIGLRPGHHKAARAEGRSETDLRRMLDGWAGTVPVLPDWPLKVLDLEKLTEPVVAHLAAEPAELEPAPRTFRTHE